MKVATPVIFKFSAVIAVALKLTGVQSRVAIVATPVILRSVAPIPPRTSSVVLGPVLAIPTLELVASA